MTDKEMLKDALEHEEEAIRLYRQYTEAVIDERIKEMFEQFAMNESWHASALRDKLEHLEE
ncbi:MAG: ferritin family protein [Candidatus Brocadiia bacterium]